MSRTEGTRMTLRCVGDLIREAADVLLAAGVPGPQRDAEWLLSAALGIPRGRLRLDSGRPVPVARRRCFESWYERRARREPLQYVIGSQPFWGHTLRVDARALLPRPESERVGDRARALHTRGAVGEIGPGSGAIAIALASERPGEAVYATDISKAALALSRENSARAGCHSVSFFQGDLLAPVRSRLSECSLVVCNPPYVATGEIAALAPEVRDWEPTAALDGGHDGLRFYRRLAAEAAALMRPGSWLVLEMGKGQRRRIEAVFSGTGAFAGAVAMGDYAGIERGLALCRR